MVPEKARLDVSERLSIFLLAHRASTNETTGTTPTNMMFGRELRLPYDQILGAPPDKEQSRNDCVAHLVDWPHDFHHYVREHRMVASDQMQERYGSPANSAGFQEGHLLRVPPDPDNSEVT